MKPSQIVVTLIAMGIVFGILSLVWPAAVGGKRAYSDADALEYRQASLELHNQAHAHGPTDHGSGSDAGHAHDHDEVAQHKAAQERMDAIEAVRDAAINKGQSTAGVFKWLGVLTLAGGIITHFATRRRE